MLLALLTMLSFTAIHAQSVKVGVKGGLNVSTFYGDDADDAAKKVGFHAGGVFEFVLSDRFSLQPELLFSAMGNKNERDSKIKQNINYLTMPVIAKFYVIEGLSVEAGPQMGYMLSSKFKYDGDSMDWEDITKDFDFGLTVGAGYRLDNGLNFGLRVNPSFTDVYDIKDFDVKNIGLQLSVGYFFM